jgi:LysR family transcriptional regulator, low CO2-responsive transcriptional regulator
VLDVEGFPIVLNWYLFHRKEKRLPPVALAFKNFLMEDGARLISRYTYLPWSPKKTGVQR